LLNPPDAVGDERVWKSGIENVWKGLNAGGRLKRRLPMNIVVCFTFFWLSLSFSGSGYVVKIKIVHAAWLRDPDTWPPGAVAPESDDLEETTLSTRPIQIQSMSTPGNSSGRSPPGQRASGLVVAVEDGESLYFTREQ
jgi:hypothetical protein